MTYTPHQLAEAIAKASRDTYRPPFPMYSFPSSLWSDWKPPEPPEPVSTRIVPVTLHEAPVASAAPPEGWGGPPHLA